MEQLGYRIGLNTFKCEIQLVSIASFIHFGLPESKVCTDKMGCSGNFLYVMIEHDTKYAHVSLLPFTNLIKFTAALCHVIIQLKPLSNIAMH